MVSSTAAATLRQLVMFVVDKVVDEDRRNPLVNDELQDTYLPNGTLKKLGPSARDTFAVFEDLCLLANSEKPHFLKLDFLHKTFALELIESVLTNYHDLFRKVNIFCFMLSTPLIEYGSIQSSSSCCNTTCVLCCSKECQSGRFFL